LPITRGGFVYKLEGNESSVDYCVQGLRHSI